MTVRAYEQGFGSVKRVALATAADPERQLRVVERLIRELAVGVSNGDLVVADWADRIQTIAEDTGMIRVHGQDCIQAMMSEAILNPLVLTVATEVTTDQLAKHIPRDSLLETTELLVRCASEIEPEPVEWLWPERIAIGKLTMIAGEPGLGKSQLTCWIAAAVSTGTQWPGNEGVAPIGCVVVLSAEDSAADTVRPRLDAAGADVTKVYMVSAVRSADGRRSFNLQADLVLLEQQILRIGDVRLVIIDPITAYLGRVDSHKNAELRAVLEPIGEMASRLRVAVVAVTHLSKSGGGGANNRIIGSIAFVAAARAAFIVCRDPNDGERRLFMPTKNNLGREGTGLGFRVAIQATPSGIVAPTIFWDADPVTITAKEALDASVFPRRKAPARDSAEDFLRDLLSRGIVRVAEIQSEAKAAGLSWITIRRAKEVLGITALKMGVGGGWVWQMPNENAHRGDVLAPLS